MQTKTKNRIVALSLSRSHIVDWQGNSETHFLNPLCFHLDDFLSCFLPYHKGLHRFKDSNGLMASEKFSILITNDFFSITKAVLKITKPVFFDVSEALSRQHNKHVCWHLVQWQYVPFNSGPSRCSGQWLLVNTKANCRQWKSQVSAVKNRRLFFMLSHALWKKLLGKHFVFCQTNDDLPSKAFFSSEHHVTGTSFEGVCFFQHFLL